METLYFIVGLAWAIISIIMVVKFFQMSSDLRALKRYFIPTIGHHDGVTPYNPNEEIKGIIKFNGITYSIINEVAVFSDGKAGTIMFFPEDRKWSFKTDNYESDERYIDVYYAAEALYNEIIK